MLTTYSSVNLVSGQSYTVNSSYQRIAGANGSETVVIPATFWNTVISGDVERVTLGVNLFNTRAYTLNGQMVIRANQGTELTITPATTGTQLTYADGNVATLTKSATGALALHYDTLNLPSNSNISLPNGDVSVRGATGTETLSIAANLRHVVVDAAVEKINFGQAYVAESLVASKGQLLVNDATGVAVAQLSVVSGHSETLSFSNARGTLGLDAAGIASFTLTDLVLDANQSYVAAQSNLRILGNRGAETVTLSSTAVNQTIDRGIEKVVFPAAYGSYTVKAGVSDVQIFNASNTLVADVFVPRTNAGTQLQFANGTWTAKFTNGVLGLSAPDGAAASPAAAPSTSGASGLKYTVSWGSFGDSQSGVQACLNKAMADLGKYFNAKGVLDLQVLPETVKASVLAEAKPAMASTSSTTASTVFQLESLSGTDSNGSAYDAVLYVNLANLSKLNLDPTKSPTASQYDLTTILEHELMHVMGFTGNIGVNPNITTPYDSLVRYVNGAPYFAGSKAQAVYGGMVPLAPASTGAGSAYYHVSVASDLMNDSIGLGDVRTLSKLDLAMLQDLGDPVLIGIAP